MVSTPDIREDKAVIHKDLDGMREWDNRSLMKYSKDKVLPSE